MKKVVSLLLVLCLMMTSFSLVSYADDGIKIKINGYYADYDVMPVIVNSRTLVPMRGIFESLGADISWDGDTKTVRAYSHNGTRITLIIGEANAVVYSNMVPLDTPAQIVNGRTMVPVRFVAESLGEKVEWDGNTKTVIIGDKLVASGKGLDVLKNTVHRPIPTEFEKTNNLNDYLYFDLDKTPQEQEAIYKQFRDMAEVVCTEDEYLAGKTDIQGPEFGFDEVVDVEGMPFKKALRITCTSVPEKSASFISKTSATPKGGVSKTDRMLFAFRMRTVSGGDENGVGKVQVQIQHPETYLKAVFEFAVAGKDWTVIYMPFRGIENATDMGIRAGFYNQVVEIGGIEILKFPEGFDQSQLPRSLPPEYDQFNEDAIWRKEATERIEKVRKGDFTVVVKDKDGNIVPDAKVELDMFEHEFEFGNAMNDSVINNEKYRNNAKMLFNAAVLEHAHKWAPYEENPGAAKKQVEAIIDLGIKNLRGHSIFWERDLGSNGKTYLTPEYIFTDEMKDPANKHLYDEKAKAHAYQMVEDFLGVIDEWDVVNEILGHTKVKDVFGPQIYKDAFQWAREAGGEDMTLYYNEVSIHEKVFLEKLDELVAMGVDFDAIGLQSHYDAHRIATPSVILTLYDNLRKYGKELKVTEFSASMSDKELQGSVMRDTMICTFAEEQMNGFLMWGFWDGANFESNSPVYDKEWNLKPGGRAYVDLVYNKWWTRDAKATTDASGKAVVRGFYGDYDVTVEANGQTKTVMVAFHKGFDNVLEITID